MLCYIKIIYFTICIHSIHQLIPCTFEFINSWSTHVINIPMAWTYFIAWTSSGCTGSWAHIDAAAASATSLLASLFFFSLLIDVSQKPANNSCCNIAYRRLFFYYQLAHGLAPGRTTLLHIFTRFVKVFHPSSVKPNALFACMTLLQIKNFPIVWFTDGNGFLKSSINI